MGVGSVVENCDHPTGTKHFHPLVVAVHCLAAVIDGTDSAVLKM
jgi:hypothetical protein